jgi:hypothetical protein
MNRSTIARSGFVLAVFVAGFVCGSSMQRPAQADSSGLGAALMKQAAGSGGALGSIAQLGTSIVDMEQHVSGLQKNIDTLKKVKTALGG